MNRPQIIQEKINEIMKCPHKDGANKYDWQLVHPNLILLADFYIYFAEKRKLPIKITRIISKKIQGLSVSNSHDDKGVFNQMIWHGRAFDASVDGWHKADKNDFIDECNEKFHIGAISFSDGQEKEVILENGTAWHFHFQVRPL